jgi:hypothetical protein
VKTEAYLFSGVAGFFLVAGALYTWLSDREPAGTAALAVSFVMASLLAFFCAANHRRRGERPEDRKDGEIAERAGRLDFFPPRSYCPPLTALGAALCALGIVYGLWLFVIGFGLLGGGVFGLAFQHLQRD